MCGISGILRFNNKKVYKEDIQRMNYTLKHRGPDGEDVWINSLENLGLGHTRLSVIDTSENGSQPMKFLDCVITFNGEIYNYIEIKEFLIKKGYVFKSNCDTEVILASYKYFGKSCIRYFDGMFSFVIYDISKNSIFGARDRFGEKPLFYYKSNSEFIFASEMKAIFVTGVKKMASKSMIYDYLINGIVKNKFDLKETFYEEIYEIPPSNYFEINEYGEFNLYKYWDIDFCAKFMKYFN